jgi:hypothetical protein
MTVRDLVRALLQQSLSMQVCVSPDTFNAWETFTVAQHVVRGEQAVVITAAKPIPSKEAA